MTSNTENLETIDIEPIIKLSKKYKFLCNNCNGIIKINQLGKKIIHVSNCYISKNKPCESCFISIITYYNCPHCDFCNNIKVSNSSPFY